MGVWALGPNRKKGSGTVVVGARSRLRLDLPAPLRTLVPSAKMFVAILPHTLHWMLVRFNLLAAKAARPVQFSTGQVSTHVDVRSQEERQLSRRATGLQNAEWLTLRRLQDRSLALRQYRLRPCARARSCRVGHRFHQTPVALLRGLKLASGPVTGISTLAAWLIQSDKSSVVGRR